MAVAAATSGHVPRRSFDALVLLVREGLTLEPESGALFPFASKRKALWFD